MPPQPTEEEHLANNCLLIKQLGSCLSCTAPCPWQKPSGRQAVTTAFCGDSRLGPTAISTQAVIASMFTDYGRLGRECPQGYYDTWVKYDGSVPQPPQNGFRLDSNGTKISHMTTILNNTEIDRFGWPNGSYVSLAGRPFSERSISPSNILKRGADGLIYGRWLTIKQIDNVEAGPVDPWYSQPGNGTQYLLPDSTWNLVGQGYLQEVI
jgi:Tuberculosis necrotizing toxin